jgi:hypothetical protein
MAAQSPLVGYNTNVRHKGKLYHIQTEDSGVSHPHVITHLFADGGRIIASRKTGYAEHLGAKELPGIVKKLMQEQHKAMFIELRDCVYDTDAQEASATVAVAANDQAAPKAVAMAVAVAASAPQPSAAAIPAVKPPRPASVAGVPSPLGRAPEVGAVPPVPPAAAFAQAAQRPLQPSAQSQASLRPPQPSSTLSQTDIDAFERAAEARLLSSVLGKARIEAGRRGLGRYQQTVSANANLPRSQRQPSKNIFGGEALRGKSLDEVILSYLSDDAGDAER